MELSSSVDRLLSDATNQCAVDRCGSGPVDHPGKQKSGDRSLTARPSRQIARRQLAVNSTPKIVAMS